RSAHAATGPPPPPPPGGRRRHLGAAKADRAVTPPHRHDDVMSAKRAVPGERVLVVRIDERPVEVEQGRLQEPALVFSRCWACFPSTNSSIILSLNAGMSSGFLLVTSPWSTTTCWSTQLPPALRMSVCKVGHDVSLL